jgi:transposase
MLIHNYGNNTIRKGKTDKKDAQKIANYAIDNWTELSQYFPEEDVRLMLKNCYRQYEHFSKIRTMMKNNLIALLDETFPGANDFFDSPARADGHQKWVDFVYTYWHVDCVRSKSIKDFAEHYQKWCKRKGYQFSVRKVKEIYEKSSELIAMFPKDDNTKMLVRQAVEVLNSTSEAVEKLRLEMDKAASMLPEYPVVMSMNGVGPTLGPQLIAEIGDVTRFTKRGALTAFAGVDPGSNQSGDYERKSNRTSKKGSPHLRKTLFLIMDGLILRSPSDDPVYAFMNKKRSQGKPYYVYMTAGANKFLRIYYGRVKEYLTNLEENKES